MVDQHVPGDSQHPGHQALLGLEAALGERRRGADQHLLPQVAGKVVAVRPRGEPSRQVALDGGLYALQKEVESHGVTSACAATEFDQALGTAMSGLAGTAAWERRRIPGH